MKIGELNNEAYGDDAPENAVPYKSANQSGRLILSPYTNDWDPEPGFKDVDALLRQVDSMIAAGKGTIEEVPTGKLLATQHWLDDNGGGDPVFQDLDDYPVVAKLNDGYFHIIDGHHRSDRAALRKQPTAKAYLFDLTQIDEELATVESEIARGFEAWDKFEETPIEEKVEVDSLVEELRAQFEASYEGNLGMMEIFQFYKDAAPEHVDLLKRLIGAGKKKEAWQLIQKVTGTELQGGEFNEDVASEAIKFFKSSKGGWPSFIGLDGDRMWDPFDGRKGKWTDTGKLPSHWKPVPVTMDDIAAGRTYIQWDKAPKSKRDVIAGKFLQLNISKIFKKIPRTVYRGFALTPEQVKKLRAGKKLKLNKQVASSWTTEKENAQTFTGAKQGVIIKKQFTMSDVICNLELLDQMFDLPLSDRYMAENEVLIRGNGIGNYLDPAVEKLEFANFYSEDVSEGVGLIRKGSNVTPDVGEAQTRKEAEKLGFKTTDDGVPPILKTSGKVNESTIVEARRDRVVLVDFQPAYSTFNPGDYDPALESAMQYINEKQPEVLAFFNGEDVGIEDTKYEVMAHFIEHGGLDEDLQHLFTFREKSYAWLRQWMDEGVDDAMTIRVIRYMVTNKLNDSREIEDDAWLQLVGEDFDYYDDREMNIHLPDINIAELKSLSGALIGGGGRHECLKEFQLLLNAFNIKYKEVQDWIYG